MTKIMVVRHALKGNGENAPKNQLSPEGEVAARELGENLPASMQDSPIKHVGGSVHSRTTHTALLIALGSGADPAILPSRYELGSEEQLLSMTTMGAFLEALSAHGNSNMMAMRTVLSTDDLALIKSQIVEAILDCEKCDGNVVLGTHNPWLQMLYESLTGKEYNAEAAELDYIVLTVDGGEIEILETNLP